MSTLKPSERIKIRVVQVPTTGELLDDYYRQRGLERGSRSVYYKAERRRCKTCKKRRHHSASMPGKCLICHRRDVVPDWRPGMLDPLTAKKRVY